MEISLKNNLQTPKLLMLLSCISMFAVGFELGGFQIVALKAAQEFGLSNAGMGTAISAQFAALVIGPLIFGRISDKIGKKPVMTLSMFAFLVGAILVTLSTGAVTFGIFIFILGIGFGVTEGMCAASVADMFREKASARLNFTQVFFSVGAIVGPFAAAFLIETGRGWRTLFIVSAVIMVIALCLMWFVMFANPQVAQKSSTDVKPKKPLFRSMFIVMTMAAIMLYVGAESGASFFADSLFEKVILRPEYSALAVSLFWLSMVPTRLLCSLPKINYKAILIISPIGFGVALVGLALARDPIFALVCMSLAGLFMGPAWPTMMAKTVEFDPSRSGTITSFLMVASGLGGMIIPVFVGVVADAGGIPSGYFFLVAIAILMFVTVIIAETRKRTKGE